MKDTVIISDLHGCLEEFNELLKIIQYNKEKIRLVIGGDVIDRGVDSIGCIRRVQELNLECVKGNHEDNAVRRFDHEKRFRETGKKNPMRVLNEHDAIHHKQFTQEDADWMRKLPNRIYLKDNWWAVHGGCEPARVFEDQKPDQLLRVRYVDKETGKAKPLKETKEQPDNTIYWAERWQGKQSIVFGHMVFNKPMIFKNANNTCVGIDTGCVYGGSLTAFFLERGEFVSVKAKQEYAPMKSCYKE